MVNKEFIKLHCFGCGVELQNDDVSKPGYIPKKLERESHFVCQRCFRLQHYNENYDSKPIKTDYESIIKDASNTKSLILLIVDLFAFESSIVPSWMKVLSQINAKFVVLANKKDVLPSAVSDRKFANFISNRFKEYDLKPAEIIIGSAMKNYNIDYLVSRYSNQSIYVFGATSVGKSSFINSFLKNYHNNTDEMITTSPYPNTTLNVIKIPLGNKHYIYDTPGILIENSIFNKLDTKLVKYVLPRKEVKPRTYQLNSKQTLIVNNLAMIDFIEGEKTSFTVFSSNDLEITRTKEENQEKVFENLIKNKQFKLLDRNINSIEDLEGHEFDLPANDCDISISGLLWIKIKANNQKVKIYAPKGVLVTLRGCKI